MYNAWMQQLEMIDVLLCDTAGRLQAHGALMAELGKVMKVMKKKMPEAPMSAYSYWIRPSDRTRYHKPKDSQKQRL